MGKAAGEGAWQELPLLSPSPTPMFYRQLALELGAPELPYQALRRKDRSIQIASQSLACFPGTY